MEGGKEMTDFKRGMRFDNDHLSYRIIYVNQELMTICDLKSSRLNIFYISKSDFSEKIMKEHMHIVQEPVYVIDINALPEKERIHYQQRRTAGYIQQIGTYIRRRNRPSDSSNLQTGSSLHG